MSGWLDFLGDPGLARAAATCAFAAVGAGLVGCVLTARRLALVADALAHSLLPGAGIAWLLFGSSMTALLVGGLIAALATALGAGLLARLTRLKEDAAFAALFSALFAVGVVVVQRAGTPVDLLRFLFGEVLAVGPADLRLAATVATLTVAGFGLFHRAIAIECFDPVFHRAIGGRSALIHFGLLVATALNLIAALHALGIVLALGLFMLPATTAYLWCERWGAMLVASCGIALVGTVIGFAASCRFALPSGPAIVAALGAMFVLSAVFSPRHGLVARLRRPHHHLREGDAHAVCER